MDRSLRRIGSILALALSGYALGQRVVDRNSNLWVSHWGDHRFSDRWSFHTEGHWRRADMGENWQQLLLRPAINYHLHKEVTLTLGYSYYINYPYGDYPIKTSNWEHHVYQQVQLSQKIDRVSVAHRFRMEERYMAAMRLDPAGDGSYVFDTYVYRSRFRYRFWATIPLGAHTAVERGTLFASFYDELFLNFGESERLDFMQQNRLSGLLGYQFNDHGSVQLGYLLQTIQRPGAASGADLQEMNSTLHLVIVYNLDFRKPKSVEGAPPK